MASTTLTNSGLQRFIEAAGQPLQEGGIVLQFTENLARFGEQLPKWWSPARDWKLGEAWRDGQHLSGVMFASATKLASMPVRVVARDAGVAAHRELAEQLTRQYRELSELGDGLSIGIERFAQDYLGTDNGGFFQIVGEPYGRVDDFELPLTSLPYGLKALDSRNVFRTNDPLYPIWMHIYDPINKKTRKIKFHMSRVLGMAQMSSTHRGTNGVGYSAVSRSIEIARDVWATYRYKAEKMGSRRSNRLLVGKGITGAEMIQAMGASVALMEALGMAEHSGTTAIGGDQIEITPVDLHNLEQFNEETAVTMVMYALALTWGLEFNEVFPGAGNKSSDVVALQRSRSRLPALFVRQFEELASMRLAPPELKIELDYDDDQLDQQRAVIADINVRSATRLIDKKVVDGPGARTFLFRNGVIAQDELDRMNLREGLLPNGNHVGSLFFEVDYMDLLLVPPQVIAGIVDPPIAQIQLGFNRLAILAQMSVSGAIRNVRRCRQALAAIDWLIEEYKEKQMLLIQSGQTGQQEEEEGEIEEEQEEEEVEEGEFEEETEEEQEEEEKRLKASGDSNSRERELALLIASAQTDLEKALEDPSEEELGNILNDHLLAAWLAGAGEDELSTIGQQAIDEEMDLFDEAIAAILLRYAKGTDMEPTAERMTGQIGRIFWNGFVSVKMGEEEEYSWMIGDTVESCQDCLTYSEMGPKLGSFWKELAHTTGHFPQSSLILCTGINCRCFMQEA